MEAKFIKRHLLGIGTSLMLTATAAFAEQPFDPEFVWKKPATLTGTVTKVEWTDPDVRVSIDVRDASGAVTSWVLELGSSKVLKTNYQLDGNPLQTGDRIAVDGWLAEDSQRRVSARSVTLSDGRELLTEWALVDLPGRCISDELCFDGESTAGQDVAHVTDFGR